MAVLPNSAEHIEARLEAQRASTLVQVGALIGAALCIAGAALLQNPINTQRKELQLVLQSNIYKELPPKYAWVSAAGGTFRGIAADILWARAEQLKQDGKYYELHQLAKWITTLQPRFPQVWQFQSWNMSYNISVATKTAPERWQWVYNGIRLIRDEGIPNNEKSIPLYQQLAWTWFHKVGDRMDDFHMTYKRVWAATMETLLGPPPVAVSNKEAIDWFRPVAEAPQRLEELLEKHPKLAKTVDDLAAAGVDVNAGTSSQNLFHPLEENFFRPWTRYQREVSLAAYYKEPPKRSPQQQRLVEIFEATDPEDMNALLAFLRAKVLREQYKMDPQYMLDLTGRIGSSEPLPIDWRTPWAQGLYWAMYGADKARELKNAKEFDKLSVDRIVLFALKTLAKSGRYVFRLNLDDPMQSFLNMLPDLRYIDAMHAKYLELGKEHLEEGEDPGNTAGETLRSGHVNELHDAIVNLYLAGRVEDARKYLEYLAVNYKELYTGRIQEQYLQSVDDFVWNQVKDMSDSYNTANAMIYSLLHAGFWGLASGYGDELAARQALAATLYRKYQEDKLRDPEGRRSLPPFEQMVANALGQFVTDPGTPMAIRAMVWQREPDTVKQRIYDFILPELKRQAEMVNFDVDKAFPEPAGMEEYRKANPMPKQVETIERKSRLEND